MTTALPPDITMGVVALSVADLERSLGYYQEHIGLTLQDRDGQIATLGVGNRPLLRLHEQLGARIVQRATGLYHFALRVPSRLELARVIQHFLQVGTPIGGSSDHTVSEALYLSDPDGHGIEIYRDRPRHQWYDPRGKFMMNTLPLDAPGIMAEINDATPAWAGLHPDTDMGHVHLQVANISAAERFYLGVLGFERMMNVGSASFISAGGYHHHLGMNTWAGVGVPAPPAHAARLLSYELCLPTSTALKSLLDQIRTADLPISETNAGWAIQDPSQNTIIVRAIPE
jgi:catechol 2,3-dioxygenase